MERRWSVPALGALVAMLAVVVLASELAPVSGAIPDPGTGQFHACLVKSTGAVRVINYPKVSTCAKGRKLIAWNQIGPQGPQGAQGAQGAEGPSGPAGITRITLTTVTKVVAAPALSGVADTVTCPAGKVTGGGFDQNGNLVTIDESDPEGANGWRVRGTNLTMAATTLTIYAICMTTEPSAVIATASKSKPAKKKGK